VQEFSLVSVDVQYVNLKKAQDQIYVVINVERNFHSYLFKIMVPLFLIFILSFAGLSLPVTALNDRLQLSVSGRRQHCM
jgi:hypothetical protein